MTAKNSDKRHPLVQAVEHFYLTTEGRKENIASREDRATEVADHLILRGAGLTPEVEKIARLPNFQVLPPQWRILWHSLELAGKKSF